MHVEPVSQYPPASSRTLAQWLDPELSARHGSDARTRMREIADGRAMRRAMWAAFLALGASAVVLGAAFLVFGWWTAAVATASAGGVVAAASALFLRRERRRIPRPGESYTTRGAGTLRGGIVAASGMFAAVNVFFIPAMLAGSDLTPILLIDAGLALLLVSGFVVPAAVIGDGRAALRRDANRDPHVAAALEHERTVWVPRAGVDMFGPL